MNRTNPVSPKTSAKTDRYDRQVKETRDLIRAADRVLDRYAKKTGTVFIVRDRNSGGDRSSNE